jgi:anti-sigma factor RsiW
MNESDYNLLQEKSWRGQLTPAEEASLRAWFAEHPEAERDWETDRHLTRALEKLPDVPVPGNFTARVLQAVDREAAGAARPRASRVTWFLRSLLPRAAVAAVVLAAGLLTYHEHTTAQRQELVQGVKVVSGVSSLPSPEILQDFDTIQQISTTPGPDQELIALLK